MSPSSTPLSTYLFELQRSLNNCFVHDLVPASEVIEVVLQATRRVDDFSIAVHTFEGIKEEVENKNRYQACPAELKRHYDTFSRMGVNAKEELGPAY